MSSALDYLDRTVDLQVFAGTELSLTGPHLATQTLIAGGGGELITGVVKLAQRTMMWFLTPKGSLRYRPDAGCDLLFNIRTHQARTIEEARQVFVGSAVDVKRLLLAEEAEDDPADERIDSIILGNVTRQRGALSYDFSITTLAGDNRQVILPIRFSPTTR